MDHQLNELVHRATEDFDEKPKWQTARFWQEIYLYFWSFALFGHLLELLWSITPFAGVWKPITPTLTPISPPYGLGAVITVLFVIPLIKKYKVRPLSSFVLCAIIAGLVEYICAMLIVAFVGYNEYWTYANVPFNLRGYVSLGSYLVLGGIMMFFVYIAYPFLNKLFKKIDQKQMNIIFSVLFF